jgi:hypothetical protein
MSTFLMRKMVGGRLEPVDDAGKDALAKVGIGALVSVEIKRPRNIQHHRKFWALISLIYQNQTRYKSPEDLCDAIKVYVGHSKVLRMTDGREVHTPLSIAFHAMDQGAFDAFYDKVIDVVCTVIIPGLNQDDLRQQLLEFAA